MGLKKAYKKSREIATVIHSNSFAIPAYDFLLIVHLLFTYSSFSDDKDTIMSSIKFGNEISIIFPYWSWIKEKYLIKGLKLHVNSHVVTWEKV